MTLYASANDSHASTITGTNDVKLAAQARLDAAIASRVDYRNRATAAVALPGCAVNCKALLTEEAAKVEAEITAARQALDRAPAKKSATPLADRLHVEAWVLDLLAAVLASLSINVTAACLIAWGCRPAQVNHAASAHTKAPAITASPAIPEELPQPEGPRPPKGGLPVPVSPRTRGLLTLIEGSGGEWRGTQKHLQDAAGLSKGELYRALQEIKTSGAAEVEADKATGTRIRLKVA